MATWALVLTDLVDSTGINARLGDDAMRALWRAHDDGARALVRQHAGLEIGRTDGFLLALPHAAAALAFVRGYRALLAGLTPPLRARVGLHLGEVSLRMNSAVDRDHGATVYEADGLAVATVSRLLALAQADQVLVCDAARRALQGDAPAEPAGPADPADPAAADDPREPPAGCWQALGQWHLKGLPEPVPLHAWAETADQLTGAPPAGVKAYPVVWRGGEWRPVADVPSSLPGEPDAFIGQAAPRAELADRLAGGERLLTLLGPGGIGKTRLAVCAARDALHEFPGGAWFCDLSRAVTDDGVMHAVAQGLGVPLGAAEPRARLAEALRGRGRCLLLLDNAEQVLPPVRAALAQWLSQAPMASALVTSRERLGLPAERVMTLEPMSLADALALFRQRMAAACGLPDDAPELDDPGLPELADLLDRLPLALELAAARTPLLRPSALLLRMGDRFRMLARRGGPDDRQATLHATLRWSWNLLSASEASTLAQLAVFGGAFTLASAEAVVGLPDGDDAWLPDVMQSLLDKSLVQRQPDGRLRLLVAVREFAATELPAIDPAGDVLRRHWRHVAAMDDRQLDPAQDLDDVVLACRRVAGSRDTASARALIALAGDLLLSQGPIRLTLDLVAGLDPLAAADPATAAAVCRVQANALYAMGRADEARDVTRRGLQAAGQAGDVAATVRLQCGLSELERAAGRQAEAAELLAQAWRLWPDTGQPRLGYRLLNARANLAMDRGDWDSASADLRQALAQAAAAADPAWVTGLLDNLGVVAFEQGRFAEARDRFAEALAQALPLNDRQRVAKARCNLGMALLELGDTDGAAPVLRASGEVADGLGHLELLATVRCNLGLLAARTGRTGEARELLQGAEALALQAPHPGLAAFCRAEREALDAAPAVSCPPCG